MLIIRHRINTVKDLAGVSPEMGIELDLRYEGSELVLQHDAFKSGEKFEDFLKHYRHALMVLNIKTEGIEEAVLAALGRHKIESYFFLDLSFPAMVKLMNKGETRMAVRFSEYEPLEQCLALKNKARWVWIDCFTRYPLDDTAFLELKKHFKLCLVSPELEQHPREKIEEMKQSISRYAADAVCTKYPELWLS